MNRDHIKFRKKRNCTDTESKNRLVLIDRVSRITNRDTDNVFNVFNAFFASVFNTRTLVVTQVPGDLCWKTRTEGMMNSQLPLNLFKSSCSSWMHINLCSLTGFISGY